MYAVRDTFFFLLLTDHVQTRTYPLHACIVIGVVTYKTHERIDITYHNSLGDTT